MCGNQSFYFHIKWTWPATDRVAMSPGSISYSELLTSPKVGKEFGGHTVQKKGYLPHRSQPLSVTITNTHSLVRIKRASQVMSVKCCPRSFTGSSDLQGRLTLPSQCHSQPEVPLPGVLTFVHLDVCFIHPHIQPSFQKLAFSLTISHVGFLFLFLGK